MKKKIFALTFLSAFALCGIAFGVSKEVKCVHAEDSAITEVAEQTETPIETIEKKIDQMISTFAPIIIGFFGVVSPAAIISIFLALMNRKTIKDLKKDIKDALKLSSQITETAKSLLTIIESDNKLSKETKETYKEQTKEIVNRFNSLAEKTENLQLLKPIVIKFAEMLMKMASNDKNMVANGLGSELGSLLEEIKSIK